MSLCDLKFHRYYPMVVFAMIFLNRTKSVSVEIPPNVLFSANLTFVSASANLSPEICATETCKLVASKIVNAIDPTIDPCDDFYQYACGNWIKSHPIPDNETNVGIFKQLADEMKPRVQGMLVSTKLPKFQSEEKAKAFFKQCINEDEVDRLGPIPVFDFLDKFLGGWPVLTSGWNATNFDLLSVLQKMVVYGYQPFFSLSVSADLTSPTENLLFIDEPSTFASVDILLSEAGKTYTDSYRTYLLNVTSLLQCDLNDRRQISDLIGELEEIVDFERNLSMAGQTVIETRDLSQQKKKSTFEEIRHSTFNRSSLAKNLLNYTKSVFSSVNLSDIISETLLVVLRSPRFFLKLDELLEEQERSAEGKRRLANYVGWKMISLNVAYLPKKYRDTTEEFSKRVNGQEQVKDTSAAERCAADTTTIFPLTVGAMYVRDFSPVDLKSKASIIVRDLRDGFEELLTEATWMDSTTHLKALEKLDRMLDFVAYPDIFVNNISLIDEDYNDIAIGKTYFETVQAFGKWQTLKNLKKLPKKNTRYDPIDDQIDVTSVNAYNLFGKNMIVILAASLQFPFFEASAPFYLNYGGSGFILGHEITHGFDDQGADFDEYGLMRSWWTNQTKETYNKRKQGIVDQYNNYSLPVGKVNGELTLGENIADNGGLKAAYRAYLRFRERLGASEPLLPGMEKFSTEKLFFISAAQIWCADVRPKTQMLTLLTEEHSPTQFRVVGPMSNMPEFSKAFQCPLGSNMNPLIKFAVW